MRLASLVKAGQLDDENVLGELLAESQRPANEVHRAWASAMIKAEPRRIRPLGEVGSPEEASLAIHRWFALTESTEITGPGAGSQRKLLTALGLEAVNARRVTFRVSIRELAERSGLGRSTVSRHLRSPVIRSFVAYRPSNRWHGKRSTFTLTNRPAEGTLSANGLDLSRVVSQIGTVRRTPYEKAFGLSHLETVLPSGHHPELLDPAHDLWYSSSGIGFALYRQLSADEPRSAVELASAAGCSKATVHRHLRRFADLGLVVGSDGRWSVQTSAEAAADTGVMFARRAERHADERIHFGAWRICSDAARDLSAASSGTTLNESQDRTIGPAPKLERPGPKPTIEGIERTKAET